MLEELKQKVYEANMLLPAYHLITFTWGNVSGIDRENGLFRHQAQRRSLRGSETLGHGGHGSGGEQGGRPPESLHGHSHPRGAVPPFPGIGGVVHTHSRWATIWAQAGRDIPAYGTTHADYIYGPVPCCRDLTEEEVERAYELETGKVIASHFEDKRPESPACSLRPGPPSRGLRLGKGREGRGAQRRRAGGGGHDGLAYGSPPRRPAPGVSSRLREGKALPAQARPERLLRPEEASVKKISFFLCILWNRSKKTCVFDFSGI